MRTNETDQKASEDGMNANDSSEKSRSESHKHRQSYDRLSRAVLNAPSPSQDPKKGRTYAIREEENIAHAGEQDVQGSYPGACVHKRYTQRE